MKKFAVGIIMVIGGLALGAYVGGYLMFVGGIVDVVNFFKQDLSGYVLGFGLLKVALASATGVFSGMVLIIPGAALIASK